MSRAESPSLPRHMKRLRSTFLKVALTVLVPVVFIVAIEGCLRLFGFGYPSQVFLENEGTIRNNPAFTFRYFPWSMARPMLPVKFAAEKPEGTIRIFVLGGSAAQGFPGSEFGIGRQLELMLEKAYPNRKFEVINAAITAINSHVVLQIARSCLKYKPDFLVLYLGNNEVVGPYGPGTVLAEFSRNLTFIRANTLLKSTRLFQLLSLAMGAHKPPSGGWRGMEMFLQNTVPLNDPRLQLSYRHLEANLRDILNLSESNDCTAIFSTIGVNLFDQPPFASVNDTILTGMERERWGEYFRAGSDHYAAGEFREAISSLVAANQIDGGYAESYYMLGRCYLEQGEEELAREAVEKSRDLDALRFRSDSNINAIIRKVAIDGSVEYAGLVDGAQVLADHPKSVQGIPGDAFFYDHVHLSFLGNNVVARAFAKEIIDRVGDGRIDLPDVEETARQLAFTQWDQLGLLELLANSLLNKPPFTDQLGYVRRQGLRKRRIVRLGRIDSGVMNDITKTYKEALLRRPEDRHLKFRFGLLLNRIGDRTGASDVLRVLIAEYPHDREARMALSSIASEKGEFTEARRHLQAALESNPYAIELRTEFMHFLYKQMKLSEAERYGADLIFDHPEDPDTRFGYGLVLKKVGKIDRAIEQFRKTVQIDSRHVEARRQIILIFRDEGNFDAAIVEAKKWIKVKAISAMGHDMLADLLRERKQFKAAAAHYEYAIKLDPDFVVARSKYVQLMARQKRINTAIRVLRQQVHADPHILEGYSILGLALDIAGRRSEATETLREGLERDSGNVKMLRELAWNLATTQDAQARNGGEAVRFAQIMVKRFPENADFLHVLAAAQAENGEFEKAVETARKGLKLAEVAKNGNLAEMIRHCIGQYKRGRSIRSN